VQEITVFGVNDKETKMVDEKVEGRPSRVEEHQPDIDTLIHADAKSKDMPEIEVIGQRSPWRRDLSNAADRKGSESAIKLMRTSFKGCMTMNA
jgi:hypothetical protein